MLVFLVALVSGTVSSIYMVYHFGNLALNESLKIYELDVHWNSEFKASIGHQISVSVNENDINRLKKLACTLMDLGVKHIDPDLYEKNPDRKNDLVNRIKEYKEEMEKLRQQGHCDNFFK